MLDTLIETPDNPTPEDAVCGQFKTSDGKLLRYDLVVLEDDRAFFPPYQAAPVVREALLREHPEIEPALARLQKSRPGQQMRSVMVPMFGVARPCSWRAS